MNSLKSLVLAGVNPALRFYRKKIVRESHQRGHLDRAREKWRLIEAELNDPPGSLLDIGCNEGYFTLEAAEKGWCAWGIERLDHAVRYAQRSAVERNLDGALFCNAPLTPEAAARMPRFDVILFLSSFHDFYQLHGGERASAMFHDLLEACGRKMIFEPASTARRFSRTDPTFGKDNDRESIERWVRALVEKAPGWQVRYMGATAYSDIEPHRFMFAIERK